MKKRNLNLFFNIFLVLFMSASLIVSCTDDITNEDSQTDEVPAYSEDIYEFDKDDLLQMEESLIESGYDVSNVSLEESEAQATDGMNKVSVPTGMNYVVKAIKVSTTTTHPNGSGEKIKISGVILVPKYYFGQLRMLIAPVPTYTANKQAPSIIFKNLSYKSKDDVNHLYFWTLQALQGFAVLFPDYPGFGDSYDDCFIPYLVQKPMVSSTIDLIKASQKVLTNNKYKYKSELIITGYSQGAYVSTALTKELETNTKHKLNVKLSVLGGTPVNLEQITNRIIESKTLTTPHLIPYALMGFKHNELNYPINLSDVLNSPYDEKTIEYFNGTYTNVVTKYPKEVDKLFTSEFINEFDENPKFDNLHYLLEKNTIQPWKNKCKIYMIHGKNDYCVYYDNAKDFANAQNKLGGKITFKTTSGNHSTAAPAYYLEASALLLINK